MSICLNTGMDIQICECKLCHTKPRCEVSFSAPASPSGDNVSPVRSQETIDWERFRKHYVDREGFEPNCRDRWIITLYHYFTFGAHEENMGAGRESEVEFLLREVMRQHADKDAPEYNLCDEGPCNWCERAAKIIGPNKRI